MSPQTARCYIAALACYARIEMMKAMNASREHAGQAQAYDENSFANESQNLEILSIEVLNQ